MKTMAIVLGSMLLMASVAPVHAHPGGHGPVSDEQALRLATLTAINLSASDMGLGFGQLDNSWAFLPEEAKKVHVRKEDYVIVSLFHEKEDRTLYVLMTITGDVLDASFSGDFPALEDPPKTDAKE